MYIRDPVSLVKPLKENATDEEKAAHQEKVVANTSKANRILVLVRHGQYNLQVGISARHYAKRVGCPSVKIKWFG